MHYSKMKIKLAENYKELIKIEEKICYIIHVKSLVLNKIIKLNGIANTYDIEAFIYVLP